MHFVKFCVVFIVCSGFFVHLIYSGSNNGAPKSLPVRYDDICPASGASLRYAIKAVKQVVSALKHVYKQLDGYIAGQDYPVYNEIPQGLSFRCDQRIPGYYSDPEAQCQVWHWCLPNGQKFSFLCPNGTIFNQFARVCDWWFNVDCASTPNLYNINEDLYKIPAYNQQQQRQ